MFSIKEQTLYILPPPRELPDDATADDRLEAERERSGQPPLVLQFSTDPGNAAVKRLRIVPPGKGDAADLEPAVEMSFHANGECIGTEYNPQTRKAWDRTPFKEVPPIPQTGQDPTPQYPADAEPTAQDGAQTARAAAVRKPK